MTKEQLIKMFKGALSPAKYYSTLRLNSDNGKYLELHLRNGKLWIAEKDLLIYFLPTKKYMEKNQLNIDYFSYDLTDKEFSDLKKMFSFPPFMRSSRRKSNKRTEVPPPNNKNVVVPSLQTYQRYKQSYPNLFDAEIIEILGNELSDKVETIQILNTELVNQITNQTSQAVWHDADKVFPEFDKNVLGFFETTINGITIEIYGICHLESITETCFGKALRYISSGEQVNLFYWTEIPKCPFEQSITKNQENENN